MISFLLCIMLLVGLMPTAALAETTTSPIIEAYTVTFDANGGSGEMAAAKVEDGKYALPECTFTAPAGKVFKCWSVDGEELAIGTELNVSKDTTVTAVWCTALSFTMTGYNVADAIFDLKVTPDDATAAMLDGNFDYYGSWYIICTDISSIENIYDSMVIDESCFAANTQYYLMIGLSAAEGCSFDGLTKENVKLNGKAADMLTPDREYYDAIFTLDKFPSDLCTVSFNAGDGSGEMESVKVEKGSKYTLPDSDFTVPEGKIFKCWNVDGASYGSGGKIDIKGDTVFTASYCSYTVTSASYTLDESTVAPNKKITDTKVSANDNTGVVPFDADAPYETDYFVCAGSGALKGEFNSKIHSWSDVTYYGGTTYYLVVIIKPQDDYSLCGLTKENVKLGDKAAAALVPYGDDSMGVAAVFALLGKAEGEICTISFDANGGSGEMADVPIESGDNYYLPECSFTPPEGKTFRCWYSGRGRMAPGTFVYSISNDITFQALWGTPITSANYTMSGYEVGSRIDSLNVSRDKNNRTGLDFDDGNYSNFYRIYKSYDAETGKLSGLVNDRSSETFAAGTEYYLEVGICSLPNYSVNELSLDNITINGTLKPISSYRSVENNIRAIFKLEVLNIVSFDAGGGTGEMAAAGVMKGSTYTLPECAFKAPEGKVFKCWSVDGVNKETGAKITVNDDTTVIAKWGTPVSSVNFTMDGYTVNGKITSLNVARDPANSTGIAFYDGVYSNRYSIYKSCDVKSGNLSDRVSSADEVFNAGRVYYLEVSVNALEDYSVNSIKAEDITINGTLKPFMVKYHNFNNDVKAIFKLDPLAELCTVSFDAGGGSGEMASVSVTKGERYELPECTFTAPAGKEFSHWSINGEFWCDSERYTVQKDITVTAVWGEPVSSASFSMSGYTVGGKVTGIKVTPDAATASTLYYENSYWDGSYIICTDASALEGDYGYAVRDTSAVFAVNKSYYLVVAIYAADNYSLAGLSKESIKLDGKTPDAFIRIGSGGAVNYAIFELGTPIMPITTFSPGNSCTRNQVVTFLWRTAGCPIPKTTEMPFSDVPEGCYYYDAVLWAVENGITTGSEPGKFCPEEVCTRSQIVTFLWRTWGSPAPTNTAMPFTDVPEECYYRDAVLWAIEKGVTTGVTATTFCPDDECIREQIVTFLWRSCGSPEPEFKEMLFTDVRENGYYYDAVLWAVENGITYGTN